MDFPASLLLATIRKKLISLNKKLSNEIWDEELAGKFIYASTTDFDDLQIVSGLRSETGIMVIEPDTYGMTGKLIAAIDADVSASELKETLSYAADSFVRNSKSHGSHVRNGRRNDRIWKTEVPVPDPATRRSRNRDRMGKDG